MDGADFSNALIDKAQQQVPNPHPSAARCTCPPHTPLTAISAQLQIARQISRGLNACMAILQALCRYASGTNPSTGIDTRQSLGEAPAPMPLPAALLHSSSHIMGFLDHDADMCMPAGGRMLLPPAPPGDDAQQPRGAAGAGGGQGGVPQVPARVQAVGGGSVLGYPPASLSLMRIHIPMYYLPQQAPPLTEPASS